MGDFLGRLGSEFKLGQTNGPMMTSQIKMPDTDLGNGVVIPGGTQAIQHPSARPTFLTSFLANLPSAIAGGVANSMQPGGGFATGLGGGFQGIERHNLLMQQMQNQDFERQLALTKEQREQQEFQANQDYRKAELLNNRFDFKYFPETGTAISFDKWKANDLASRGGDTGQALSIHRTSDPEQLKSQADDFIAKHDLGPLTSAQQASRDASIDESQRVGNLEPFRKWVNGIAADQNKSEKEQVVRQIAAAYDAGDTKKVADLQKKLKAIDPFAQERIDISLKGQKDSEAKQNQPSNSTKTMIEAAPNVLKLSQRVRQLVNQQERMLGPGASRWAEFMSGSVGAPNAEFTKLRTNVGLLTTLLMRMHVGARGGEYIMQHFQGLIDSSKQSPENLRAALDEIESYARDVQAEGKPGGGSQPGIAPDSATPTYRFNPTTGKIEAIQ